MQRIDINVESSPEVVVRITWRQWEDGRWEAWLVDESGLPAHRVQDRQALARYLQAVCADNRGGERGQDRESR